MRPADRRVVKAEQQEALRERAEALAAGGVQRGLQLARRKLNARKAARDAAARREDIDAAGVGVLAAVRVALVVKAGGVGERADRVRGAGEEMPAVLAAIAAVALRVAQLALACAWRRSFRRIDAHDDHVEVLADGLAQVAQVFHEAAEHDGAEVRAIVIGKDEDVRALAEPVAEARRSCRFHR